MRAPVLALLMGALGTAPAPRMDLDAFLKLREAGQVALVDVRWMEAYRKGHIPGALSIPEGRIAAKAAELKKTGKTVVLYCA